MVRFCIVGTGRISDWVLKGAVQDPRFKAVAVCSRSRESASDFIRRHPECFTEDTLIFTSIDEMASSPEIDAVYIGTPNITHHPYSLVCLRAGKHVLCEKPLACNESQVKEMTDASRTSGKALMEAMISTLNPNFIAARSALSGIGSISAVYASYCQYSTKIDALKKGVVSNSFNPEMGGGALEDIGVYTTLPVISLFGEPDSVYSECSFLPSPKGNINIGGTVILRYGGFSANLSYSKAYDAHIPTEICGANGSVLLDNLHNAHKAELIEAVAPSGGQGPSAPRKTLHEGLDRNDYYYEFKEFMDVVEDGKVESSVNTHELSLVNRRVMDKVLSSVAVV